MSGQPGGAPDRAQQIDRQIDALGRRLDYFSEQVALLEEPASSLLSTAIEELSAAIEELEVATEEIHAQNDTLTATQQQLALVATHNRELFVLAPDGYLVTDLGGLIVEANRAAADLLGASEAMLVGKPLVIFIGLENRQLLLDALRDALATETEAVVEIEALVAPSKGATFPASIRLVAGDGQREDSDRRVRWLMRDVSRRVAIEQALAASEARYRLIAANSADVIVTTDAEDRVTYASPSARAVLGWEPELLEGRPLVELVHPHDRGSLGPVRDEVVVGGHVRTITIRIRQENRRYLAMEAHIGPLVDAEGNRTGIQATFRDVADREATRIALQGALAREREASASLRAADAVRDTLLLAVAHDLRTPVAAAAGLAEILLDQHPRLSEGEVRRVAEGLASTTGQLRAILDNLLEVERVVGGHIAVERQRADLTGIVRFSAAEHGLSATTATLPTERVFAEIDVGLTQRIIDNLLSNAIRHAPSGSLVRVEISAAAGGDVVLCVEDDGPGVPNDLKETIFEAFQRQAGAASGGLGLGLYLVRRFAELQGGAAWVEDAPSGGAAFRVRFRAARPD